MTQRVKTGGNKPRYRALPQGRDWMVIRWMLILRPAIVTATLGVAMLIYPQGMINKTPIGVIVVGTYVLTILYWLAHKFSGIFRTLLAIQLAFDVFTITVIIHYTGNIESPFVGFYFLVIMCGSLFFRRLVTILFTVQAIVFYVVYNSLYLFNSELNIEYVHYVQLQTILYSVLMFGIGLLSSIFAERLFKKDTELTSALRLLVEAKLDTSDILQSMTNGLITVNMQGTIVYLNHSAERILQINSRDATGRNYRDVLGSRAGEMGQVIERGLLREDANTEREIQVNETNGHPVPIGLTSVPLYDTDKSRRGIILNFKNLTERKKLLEMIRQADRMAAIGELSAAIAHEVRNPLASMGNAIEVLKDILESDEPHVGKLLNIIEKESNRLHRISSDFLDFARVKDSRAAKLDLRRIVEDVVLLIENDPRMTTDVSIQNEINTPVFVKFDEDHLKQLMINIIINSLEAMKGRGEISIRTENKVPMEKSFIRLVIYDNGSGFPEDTLKQVFEPFFSTKRGGTGLGLALVRKLVISNHGRVLARNREGAGAEIALDIPVYGDE